MQRIKTLIIERQCDGDNCNVGDRHEFHCLVHQEWDKKALAESRRPLKCPACNNQIHTYTKEVYRNVPHFNKDTKPKTITVKRTCSGSSSNCGFSHRDEMSVLPGDLYEFPTIDWWWRCPKCRADFVPSITQLRNRRQYFTKSCKIVLRVMV